MFRRLKAAWLFSREFPYVQDADNDWSDQDSINTRQFFASGTGLKLSMRLRNYAVRSAMQAVQKPHGEHANGVAAGIAMTSAMIDAHMPVIEEETDKIVSM